MQLKIAQKGVAVTLNSLDRDRLAKASDLADRIGYLPCDQQEKARAAQTAIDALVEAFESAGDEPKE